MLKKIFKKEKNIIIGAVHFPPLLGYPDFPGMNVALKNAIYDLKQFEKGGADAVIIENNYDLPHTEKVSPAVVACLAALSLELKKITKIPIGISVLWNDYETALSIAKLAGLSFIRVPVFVDKVKTACGIITGQAKKVTDFRKKIGAQSVQIFADIHVKHAQLLSKNNLLQSAKLAIKSGADALIITGTWTGDAPAEHDLKKVRSMSPRYQILAGSGVDEKNIKSIFKYANGCIVSTSLKKGKKTKRLTNLTGWNQRIDSQKVKKLKIQF